MKCLGCRSAETRTRETTDHGKFVMRRQRCEACGGTWSTQETPIPESFEHASTPPVPHGQGTATPPVPQKGGKGFSSQSSGSGSESLPLFSGSSLDASLESSLDRETDERWPADFAAFIDAYPKHRRKNKAAALRAWRRRKPPLDKVLSTLAWQVRSHDWTKEGGQFVPLPASYINAGAYLDEQPESASQPRKLLVLPKGRI